MADKNFDRAEAKANKRLRREARLSREAEKMAEAFDTTAFERNDAEFLAIETEAEFAQNSCDRY